MELFANTVLSKRHHGKSKPLSTYYGVIW